MDIKLTIEQENAVDIIHSRLVKGEPVTTFQAPAGCGKTVTTSFLVVVGFLFDAFFVVVSIIYYFLSNLNIQSSNHYYFLIYLAK